MDVVGKILNRDHLLETLLDLKKQYKIDCLNIFVIDKETAWLVEEIGADEEVKCNLQLAINNSHVFSTVKNALKPIHYKDKERSDISKISKDAIEEIYIPIKLFQPQDLIICIYIAFKSIHNAVVDELIEAFQKNISSYEITLYSLEKYFSIYKLDKNIKLLMLLQDSIKINQPFMVLHPMNVAFWSLEIARELKLDDEFIETLYYAAIFHDIGKIGIRNEIINKEASLTKEEYEIVKKHVEYGYFYTKEILGDIYPQLPRWVYSHHEKYDGTGYPEGLKGEEIPLGSRILKVADVIDILYSPRSYKKPVSIDRIISELKRCEGKDFDPRVVKAALKVIGQKLAIPVNILNDNFDLAHLSILTDKGDIFNYDGYYYREGNISYFKCFNINGKNVFKRDIVSCSLVIAKLNRTYEYKVDIDLIEENTFILSNIKPSESGSSFSILWNLPAILYYELEKGVEVEVVRISADYFIFAFSGQQTFQEGKVVKSKLLFDDGEEILLSGRIDYSYMFADGVRYYKYSFINLSDGIKDRLFRQIFRKQINLRRKILSQ